MSRLRKGDGASDHAPEAVRTRKAKGELAEIKFLEKAAELGYVACKPFGDNARFDFLVEARGRVSRVQVKSGWMKKACGAYYVRVGCSGPRASEPHRYTKREIDFVVAYVAGEQAWYVIPVRAIRTGWVIRLGCERGRYEKYRERWELLLHPTGGWPTSLAPST